MAAQANTLRTKPLLTGMNPEDGNPAVSFKRNSAWDKPGPYVTKLSPIDEKKFQQWVRANKIPWRDIPTADYDMRGYWKALQSGKAKQSRSTFDKTMHFPDTWKTPYDAVFSKESMYAKPNAPRWIGDKLYDDKGNLIVDETPKTVTRKGITIKSNRKTEYTKPRKRTTAKSRHGKR